MERAYDFSNLVARLKSKGLEMGEEAAKLAVIEMIEWLDDSAAVSANPYDDLGRPVLPMVKQELLKLVDKIDGQVG